MFLLLVFLIIGGITQAYGEQYRKVSIDIQGANDFRTLADVGLIFDHVHTQRNATGGWHIEAVLDNAEFEALQKSGFVHRVLVENVAAEIQQRQPLSAEERQRIRRESGIAGFEFGSMGGYYTYDEVVAELDSMRLMYPTLVSEKISIGQSIQGRDIWVIKLSDNPDSDEAEPEILYDALHHSREPQGMMTLMYFMYYLLENYDSNPQVAYLLDNRELFFIPVVNPDGYVYNQQTNPNGGGMWRKNRRNNGGSFGVDLNRNYGYEWGYDDIGSSPNPNSNTYRGPAPFSEPETQAYRDFALSRAFRLNLSYHTYSNVLIYPFGYDIDILTPDSLLFREYAKAMTAVNNYAYGTVNQTLGYVANGGTFDWMYGEQGIKDKVISFTPEVGSSGDGFWPAQSRIYPLAQENLSANVFLARVAGAYVVARSGEWTESGNGDGYVEPGEQFSLVIELANLGLDSAATVNYTVQPSDSYLSLVAGGQGDVQQIPSRSNAFTDTLMFEVSNTAPPGYRPTLALSYEYDSFTFSDTLRNFMTIGVPVIVFRNDAEEGMLGWNPGQWGQTGNAYVSPSNSFTDSPQGDYPANANNAMTLQLPVDLSGVNSASLEYHSRWDIETGYDFAQVKISTNGSNWTPLAAPNMVLGSNGAQPPGQPGYHGVQSDWISESIDISDYAGEPEVYLQFVLLSDGFVEGDGWYLDDIQVQSYTTTVTIDPSAENQPLAYALAQNYPNPFNPETTISYSVAQNSRVEIAVYNLLGERVATLANRQHAPGNYEIVWDASNIASGLYLVRMSADGFHSTVKMMLNK